MKQLIPWAIIVILLLLGWFFWPSKTIDTSETDRKIAQRDSLIHQIGRENQALLTRIRQDSIIHIEKQDSLKTQAVKFKGQVIKLKKNPIVIHVREEVPEVDTLVVAYDSLLASKDQQIYVQGKYISTLQQDLTLVNRNCEERFSLQAANLEDQKALTDAYQKEARKERRQKRLAKIFVPIGIGLGFWAGSR